MNKYTEGDARKNHHATVCKSSGCNMSCRCWCHGILRHPDGSPRADAEATKSEIALGKIRGFRKMPIEFWQGSYGQIVIIDKT